MSSILKIDNLVKSYSAKDGKKLVLKGINLEIKQGEFFGLLGPNGAGKSTLINIIASIVKKTSGSVKICGYDLDAQKSMVQRSIGVVPQEVVFDPFFTVKETLRNHGGYFGIRVKDSDIDNILEKVGLTKQANYNTRKLSGGMKRRLLIAKALINKPKLLFLDEPTAGVDVELREQLWSNVKELNKSGTTIFLTTHYMEEAEELCSDIAVINNGEIVAHQKKKKFLEVFSGKKIRVIFTESHKKSEIQKRFSLEFTEVADNIFEFLCLNQEQIMLLINELAKYSHGIKDIVTNEVKLENTIKELLSKNR